LLADRLSARNSGRLEAFAFRGLQPLFAGATINICGLAGQAGHFDLWVETPKGEKAMVATAQLAAGNPL